MSERVGVGDERASPPILRAGHRRSVSYLATRQFVAVKRAVEERLGVPVYFRPTEAGVTPVVLDGPNPLGCVPALPRIKSGAEPTELDLIDVAQSYADQPTGNARPEAALEAGLIRAALTTSLRMDALGPNLRFLHSQWRLAGGKRVDVVGVDVAESRLVIVELKPASELGAFEQARSYRQEFEADLAELRPFFSKLASAMSQLYAADELPDVSLAPDAVDAYVAWPGTDGRLEVFKLQRSLGPQARRSDTVWRARMRMHQSWWRAQVADVPHGVGPSASGAPRGSMLTRPSAEAGRNFFTEEIFAVAKHYTRLNPEGVKPYRTLHNLLSSQPMAFNLFAPLRVDRRLARQLLSPLVPGGVSSVDCVEFEWKPEDHPLDDGTAFDVFIRYLDTDGERRFLGVETKLTEPFSQDAVRNEARYHELAAQMPSIWVPAGPELPLDIRWFQLLRNHLLVEHLAARGTHGPGRAVIVGHPLDPDLQTTLDAYRMLLTAPDRLLILDVEAIVRRWNRLELDSQTARWLGDFNKRYVDLNASEQHWRELLGAAPVSAEET